VATATADPAGHGRPAITRDGAILVEAGTDTDGRLRLEAYSTADATPLVVTISKDAELLVRTPSYWVWRVALSPFAAAADVAGAAISLPLSPFVLLFIAIHGVPCGIAGF